MTREEFERAQAWVSHGVAALVGLLCLGGIGYAVYLFLTSG